MHICAPDLYIYIYISDLVIKESDSPGLAPSSGRWQQQCTSCLHHPHTQWSNCKYTVTNITTL